MLLLLSYARIQICPVSLEFNFVRLLLLFSLKDSFVGMCCYRSSGGRLSISRLRWLLSCIVLVFFLDVLVHVMLNPLDDHLVSQLRQSHFVVSRAEIELGRVMTSAHFSLDAS